ncbi:MAG TPA: XRE family transcriptional regulator [Bryobacteraceae bacterium]|jgi:transcriptional regulator with XRE-family HTH domain|nr:XRE family transcriptional regulator [Bryobacteraceae bacterium]
MNRLLAQYNIGAKLRRLRLRKKIGLVDLGKHTGLSASLLSQLETGKVVPTLSTLSRVAMVFDVGLEYFFDVGRSKRVFCITRGNERLRFPERPDSPLPSFFFEVLAYGATEKRFSAYLAEFPLRTAEQVREHYHEGWELVHVLSGELQIRYQEEDHLLQAGDSVYFDSIEPHSYLGRSEPAAQAIVVTSQAPV